MKFGSILLILYFAQTLAGPICRSIALEGGGSYGAYEAGVLWALANISNPEDITWNVVSGISVGSVNAGGLAQFPIGQEKAAADFIINVWKSINSNADIFKEWEGGLIAGLLFHPGLYNTEPLVEFLKKNFVYPISRNFTIGSTNLDTGLFETFNESVGAATIDAVLCSAAPPPLFPTRQFEGYTWADGGCIMNLDVASAIERCLELTEEENIITDLIYDNPYALLSNETTFKTPEVFARVNHIASYDSSIWYTYNTQRAYPKVYIRYAIHPSETMPGGFVPLHFIPSVLDSEIQMGINDTLNYIKLNKSGRAVIQNLYTTNQAKIIFPN